MVPSSEPCCCKPPNDAGTPHDHSHDRNRHQDRVLQYPLVPATKTITDAGQPVKSHAQRMRHLDNFCSLGTDAFLQTSSLHKQSSEAIVHLT